MSFAVIRSDQEFEFLGEEFMKLDARHNLVRAYGFTFSDFAARPGTCLHLVMLMDEYVTLDMAYGLKSRGHTLQSFLERPWHYRNLTELLHDGSEPRPLLGKQRIAAMKADKQFLREETRPRLHNGEIFQPLHHHRHRRGGQMQFTRKERT